MKDIKEILEQYKKDLENELAAILGFWQQYLIDNENGGFYGELDNNNNIIEDAPRGSVLNSRILWTFSAAFNLRKDISDLHTAERAFGYLRDHFIDKEFGGVYWTVDKKGNPLDTKKHVYALAFAIYGLTEFYISTKNPEAKNLAIDLYDTIVKFTYDHENGGYLEAFSRDWKEVDDLRLSEKDANEKKTMNSHLHLLEAFGNLRRIWINEKLDEHITELVFIFLNRIIDPETHHLVLFFDEKWNKRPGFISYGHDIEAAWLLEEAAEIIHNAALLQQVKEQTLKLVIAASDGLDTDGGLWNEYDVEKDDLVKEKHWWSQAESMIGFFNAWQITGDDQFLDRSLSSWNFIQEHLLDKKNGEWFWGIKEDNRVMEEDKAGLWKCPYHNGRACMELIRRIRYVTD